MKKWHWQQIWGKWKYLFQFFFAMMFSSSNPPNPSFPWGKFERTLIIYSVPSITQSNIHTARFSYFHFHFRLILPSITAEFLINYLMATDSSVLTTPINEMCVFPKGSTPINYPLNVTIKPLKRYMPGRIFRDYTR